MNLRQCFVTVCVVLGIGINLNLAMTSQAMAVDWQPTKPVEFVIMAGPGGGADKIARLMQRIIEQHNLSPQPFVLENKEKGLGVEALRYLKAHQGNNHVIMVTLNSFYTTSLRWPGSVADVMSYAPIARMAEDPFLLWVHADSSIKTVEAFVQAAKAAGPSWIMGGTGKASADNLLTRFLNAAYGLKMKYRPFQGGGRVAEELAERRVQSTVNNPSEQMTNYEAGKSRALAAFTAERLPRFEEVPTFRELGQDFVYLMQRSIVGAPGMSLEAEAFYRDVFRQVYDSKAWQDYMASQSLQGGFLTGEALKAYWKKELKKHQMMLKNRW